FCFRTKTYTRLLIREATLTRHHTDLCQKADYIFFCPFLNELSVRDAMYGYRSHLQIITSARSSGQVTFMLAVGSEARNDLISFGNLIFNFVVTRSCLPEDLERLF